MAHKLPEDFKKALLATPTAHVVWEDITAFTPDGDFFRSNPATDKFYPNEEELKNLYADWEILQCEEAESRALKKKLDGSSMLNTVARLLAKKG